jgi:hypothetical protein
MFTKRQSLRVTNLATIKAGKGDFLVYEYGVKYFQVTHRELEQLKADYPKIFENKEYVVLQLKETTGPSGQIGKGVIK